MTMLLEEAKTGSFHLNTCFCFYVLDADPDFSSLNSKFKHSTTRLVSLSLQLPVLLQVSAYIFSTELYFFES